jgi:hypothetical protein
MQAFERYDFFLSRRGLVAAIAREVTDVLLISPSAATTNADSLVCVAYSPDILGYLFIAGQLS